jgi:hypothetical protein
MLASLSVVQLVLHRDRHPHVHALPDREACKRARATPTIWERHAV